MTTHFIDGTELGGERIRALIERACELKSERRAAGAGVLGGRSVALVFEAPSTRTRVSFEVGVSELGGPPVVLRADEMQLSRDESPGDTARVLSRFVSAIVIRSRSDEKVAALAEGASVPVVNALTPLHHPCQALADLQTLRERFGTLDGVSLAYVGDGNNVARSLAIVGEAAGVEVRVASPEGFELEPGLASMQTRDPREAAEGADALYADVWVSMNDSGAEAESRREALEPYRLDEGLMELASERAIALHCLPAHPGEEISAEVLYGDRSAVFDQAENRLHAQKALLEMLLGG